MTEPYRCLAALSHADEAALRERAVFECSFWRTQVDGIHVLCPYPLVLESSHWDLLAEAAESLSREALHAERTILANPQLLSKLGLPKTLARSLAGYQQAADGTRVIRFDFHWTTSGWQISEANTDVMGGFIESSGLTKLMESHYNGVVNTGDPAGAVAAKLAARGSVGLLHLPNYFDDRQVMLYLARRIEEAGGRAYPVGGYQLEVGADGFRISAKKEILAALFRFFPAHWLPRLAGWRAFFRNSKTEICNPAISLISQSKRFPLVWEEAGLPMPAWRQWLPETRVPDDEQEEWVLKPAFGFEGKNVAVPGGSSARRWKQIQKSALQNPERWAAQRKFTALPVDTPDGPGYPCVGVFVIDGKAEGAYGRISSQPLIDDRAREIVILKGVER